jgi:hypothetical protein
LLTPLLFSVVYTTFEPIVQRERERLLILLLGFVSLLNIMVRSEQASWVEMGDWDGREALVSGFETCGFPFCNTALTLSGNELRFALLALLFSLLSAASIPPLPCV